MRLTSSQCLRCCYASLVKQFATYFYLFPSRYTIIFAGVFHFSLLLLLVIEVKHLSSKES